MRAYSHQGHGPRADQTGRIHISDFRNPRTISLAKRSRSIHWGHRQISRPLSDAGWTSPPLRQGPLIARERKSRQNQRWSRPRQAAVSRTGTFATTPPGSHSGHQIRTARNRSALPTTLTEESVIAPAATSGDIKRPKAG